MLRNLVLVLIMSASLTSEALTLGEVKPKLSNPKKCLEYLYSDPTRWNTYISNISQGKINWLKTWVNLRKVSDAGPTSELDIAYASAIEKNPDKSLKIILDGWIDKTEAIKIIQKICESSIETYANQSMSEGEYKKRTKSLLEYRLKNLEKINSKELVELINTCNLSLKEQLKNVSKNSEN
ncbi:hypothetical protein [Bdellovibrio sp. BCCA]|uniref:hypothetical protein n=1 Tax=Bdellovibrio sp. BCCA TaxID=3136281 RepID=UPI0030F07BED